MPRSNTVSQVGKMLVAYTFSSASALLTSSSDPVPSSSPIAVCEDIHGNCDAWHRCVHDNNSRCIWGISMAAFTVTAVLMCTIVLGLVKKVQRKAAEEPVYFGDTQNNVRGISYTALVEKRLEVAKDEVIPDISASTENISMAIGQSHSRSYQSLQQTASVGIEDVQEHAEVNKPSSLKTLSERVTEL